jgi:hypothetical protein
MLQVAQKNRATGTVKTLLTTSMHTGTGQSFTGCVRHSSFYSFILIYHIKLADYLLHQFRKYWDEWREAEDELGKLTARFSSRVIDQWLDMEKNPCTGGDGKLRSLFQVISANGMKLLRVRSWSHEL